MSARRPATDTPPRVMASLMALSPMRTYAGIVCPTLVVHSEQDPIPAGWSRLLSQTIPGAEFVLLDDASHFSMIENGAALRSAVVPWLTMLMDDVVMG